jgi:MFS superfamily sulfate permease-like transporter
MLFKKILRWGLLPTVFCAVTTFLLLSNNTISEIQQMSSITIIIQYFIALIIGLLSEVCSFLVGRWTKKKQFYEKIMKNKPSVYNWLKFFT